MSEHRTEEEQTQVALAMLDGMADLWFAESGFEKCNFPEPIVRAIKQAHHEGLYIGRTSNVDETLEKAAKICDAHITSTMSVAAASCAEQIRKLKKS